MPGAAASELRPAIAFASNRDGTAQIYVMDADGSNQTRVTHSLPDEDMQPSWSPDGSQLVFTRGHPYQSGPVVTSSVVAMNADGSHERVLADDPGVNFKPVWSPDGSRIAYVHTAATAVSGPFDLWLMNSDGSSRHALTTSGDATQPSWSPDGESLVYNRGAGLAIINVATRAVRALPAAPSGADYTPSWAPGNKILFTSTRDGGGKQVYVVNPDGSGVRRLADDGAEDKYPSWVGGGTRILYSRSTVPCVAVGGECGLTQVGGFEIFAMNADGTHVTQLTSHPVPEPEFGDGYPVWRPGPPAVIDAPAPGRLLPRTGTPAPLGLLALLGLLLIGLGAVAGRQTRCQCP